MKKRVILHGLAIRFLILTFTLSIPFFHCSTPSPVQKGIRDKEFLIGNQTEPEDLDPHIVTGIPEFHIISSLLEGLVVPDPVDLKPLPGVAQSWEVSGDNLTYTFHLGSNRRWSNGDPVKASDFLFSYQRILSPALGAEYAYMLFSVKGAQEYNKGELTDFSQTGFKAIDDTTLVIDLKGPVPYFLSLITHHSWYPVHPPTILKAGAIDQRGTSWTRAGNFVGNGPFILEKWDINREIRVTKNSGYWDSKNVSLNALRFFPIDNMLTEERSFRTGQLHITRNVPLTKVEWYKSNEPKHIRIDPYLGTYFYLINTTRKPFDDSRVRRALALAIDRKALTDNILKGGQIPAHCFTPPNTADYSCEDSIYFDTTEARRLLKEAGYDSAHPFPSFSLLYNTQESHHTIAQAIQQMWKQYLGINVELINQEWKVYLNSKTKKEYDIARMGWIGDYNDPLTFLDLMITDGGNNNTGWSNAAYDSLIREISVQSDPATRIRLFGKAEKIFMNEMPVLPIYFYTNVYLIHPSVKGWAPNILDLHPYKFITLQE